MDFERLRQTALSGNVEAMWSLAQAYEFGLGCSRDRVEARRWLQLGAAAGASQCQLDLGEELDPSSGLCEGAGDAAEAERWYQLAIAGGNREAYYPLGRLLLKLDRLEAAALWLQQAAELGSTPAMRRLGELSETGRGRPIDLDLAKTWYQQAAGLGDDLAQKALRRLMRKKPTPQA